MTRNNKIDEYAGMEDGDEGEDDGDGEVVVPAWPSLVPQGPPLLDRHLALGSGNTTCSVRLCSNLDISSGTWSST